MPHYDRGIIIKNKMLDFLKSKFIFFCGIGGIGMSGIAEILHNLGYKVTGSDSNKNANVERLQELGIDVFIGQSEANIENSAVIVRSSAIKDDNIEIVGARKRNIPVIFRADMLKEIMFLKKSITVAGTHGKTTTTSMIAHFLEIAKMNPTVINGGILNYCNSNAYLGSGDWLVAEADESDGSFSKLPANIAIVTNIDPEHMEFYGSLANLHLAFKNFIEKVPFYGFAVLCYDHPVVKILGKEVTDRKIISYGIEQKSVCVRGVNLRLQGGGVIFDVEINLNAHKRIIQDVFLPMYGKHNILNSLAAISVACGFGFSDDIIKESLQSFMGVKRRLTNLGEVNGVTVIDDYGHHPTEITASLNAVRQMVENRGKGRVIAVVQPHRYSRVYDLFNEFVHCFLGADLAFIADIYEAGEKAINGISKNDLVARAQEKGNDNIYDIENLDNLAKELQNYLQDGDIVICLGAGDITKYAAKLFEQLKGSDAAIK